VLKEIIIVKSVNNLNYFDILSGIFGPAQYLGEVFPASKRAIF